MIVVALLLVALTAGGENPLTCANIQGGRIRELRGTLKRSIRNMENLVIPVDFIPEVFRERGPQGKREGNSSRTAWSKR